ncbi:MAG: hypothetical protein P8H03_02310 [Emcibacteraceae bacterium]|nr:hypothetical protein [Emcibacteraceae bacterium]
MLIEEICDSEGKVLVQIYDLNNIETTSFPTPENWSMQFGVGCAETNDKVFIPHVHKDASRKLQNTGEFIYVTKGRMEIFFLDQKGSKLKKVSLSKGMAFLQMEGGHAIKAIAGSNYFELKQGPYLGRNIDKFDVEIEGDW